MNSLLSIFSLYYLTTVDCGIIPHTTDVDLAIRYEDYNIKVKNAFLGNKRLRLLRTFGIVEHGLELRLHTGSFQYDVFLCYKYNSTHFWAPYHGNIKLYK